VGGSNGRWWWTGTGITLIVWALQISNGVSVVPWSGAAVVALAALGLCTVVASLSPEGADGRALTFLIGRFAWSAPVARWWTDGLRTAVRRLAPWVIALAVVAAFGVWSFLQIRTDPTYSTDEVAFDQYAATLALHGSNPYVHSMAPAFDRYNLSPNGATFQLDGTRVTSLSYPALSFELYLPFLALGWSTQLAVALNVASWAVAILLLFGMLPRHVRASALVLGSLSTYAGYAVGGITDALYVPLLLGAAFFWERSARQRGRVAWVSPVLFGLAMAVKQTPWLVLPFVLIGIASEGRIRQGRWGLGAAGRYLLIAAGAFAVPNLPYALAAPHQWVSGILTPLLSHTVPAGQGLIGLSLFLHIGGGSLFAYSVATVAGLVILAAVYAASYPLLRNWTFVLPALVLFFAARSFGSYLVMLLPVGLLAAATQFGDSPQDSRPDGTGEATLAPPPSTAWRYWPLVALAGVLSMAGIVADALVSSAPLSVSIANIRTTGQLATVERIDVHVRNRSNAPVTPAFTVESGGVISAFWRVLQPERPLAPGRQASYTLLSPNEAAQPAVSGGFAVTAFTTSPASVSTSDVFLPQTWHVALLPDAVSGSIAIGAPVTIHAEILDQLNRRVRVSEIPVSLGQVIYDQHGLINSSASINGSPSGRTPVSAITNRNGMATFVIRGTEVTANPVYFEANLVNLQRFYPYGYSDILLIRFGHSS
jgi:hypothetical protein